MPAQSLRTIAVEGDVALRAQLEQRLMERGFSLDQSATARASIAAIERGLAVSATDHAGRTAERTLPDLDTAASWIESWIRTDLYASLLRPEPATAPVEIRRPIRPNIATSSPALEIERPPRARARSACPTQIAARAETSVGNDGRPVIGGAIGAATEKLACLGVEARFGRTKLEGAADERLMAEALVEAGWPIVLGPVDLTPSAGFGVVWQRTARLDELSQDTWHPRLELALNAALPVAPYTAIEVAIAFDVALGAHTEKFYPYGTTTTAPGDPSFDKIESTALPGEAWMLVRFGLGLRFDFGGTK